MQATGKHREARAVRQYSAAAPGRKRPRKGGLRTPHPVAQATALTMSSTTFFASPKTIMVLSR